MHTIFQHSKSFFLNNYFKRFIYKPKYSLFCQFDSNIKQQNIQKKLDKVISGSDSKIAKNELQLESLITKEKLREEKTRKEEVMFYIMLDKYSVKPDKEYRISHTTLEITDIKTKFKEFNVLYYGNL